MDKIFTFVCICIILVGKVCATSLRDVTEKYFQEEIFLGKMVNSVNHVIRERLADRKPHHCVFVSSPSGSRPLAMTNMLQPVRNTLVLFNTWGKSEANETLRICRSCRRCEDVIIFVSKAEDVGKLINVVNLSSSAEVKLLIVICEDLHSDTEARISAKIVVDLAWRQYLQYAIVLVPVRSRILALKSRRHLPLVKCRPEPPGVIAYWEEGNKFAGNLSFEGLRYEKCVVRVASGDCSIFVRVIKSNGEDTLAGVEGLLMDTISKKHNFTVEVINVAQSPESKGITVCPKEVPNNWMLVRDKLHSGLADVALCSLWITDTMRVKFSSPYVAHYVVLMVPVPKYIPLASITQTFSLPVWICIMVGLVVGRLLIRVNRSSIPSLTALALFLGVSVASNPRGFVERWQITLWVVYGYLITQSYIASLSSILNNPWSRRIETIEELAKTEIPVTGPSVQLVNFEGDERYARILRTFVALNQLEYTQVVDHPETIALGETPAAVLVDVLDRQRWGSKFYQLKEGVTNYPIGMAATTPGVISLRQINPTIASLLENGLIPEWTRTEVLRRRKQLDSLEIETPSPTLSLEEVTGIFMILATGLALSTIVFLFEIYKRKSSTKN